MLTSMFIIISSTDLLISVIWIVIDYNGVDNSATSLMLQTSSLIDLLASATPIVFEYDKVYDGNGE